MCLVFATGGEYTGALHVTECTVNNKNPMYVMNAYSDCCFQGNDAQAVIRMCLSKFNTTLFALYSLTFTWPLHKNVQLVIKMC